MTQMSKSTAEYVLVNYTWDNCGCGSIPGSKVTQYKFSIDKCYGNLFPYSFIYQYDAAKNEAR